MTERNKRLVARAAGISLAAGIALASAGCRTATVSVETAERRAAPIVREFAARLEAAATVEVRANVEGWLIQKSFLEGNMVRKGQVLFRIDPRRCEAAVQLAKAAVERAEADLEMAEQQQHLVNAQSVLRRAEADLLKSTHDLERIAPLAQRRAVPARDLDAAVAAQASAAADVEDARATVKTTTVAGRNGLRQAKANLIAAKAALTNAELDLDETIIRAPISGLIGRGEVSVGNYVGRGEASRLATITPLDPINADFSFSETYYLHVTARAVDREALNRIGLTLADNSTYPLLGKFTNIGRAIDAKTGTILVEAQFPNPKGTLLPGMSGKVRMTTETRPDAVLVSELAVFDAHGSKAVYIVTPENKVAIRTVGTDGIYQGKTVIAEGLRGGEAVIVEGMANVAPGQTVITRPAHAGRDR